MQLETAIHTLEASLGQLEAAVQRKLDLDKRRGDFETELAIMQDDRARLATELDGALTRLKSVESAAEDAVARLDRAMGVIQGLAGEGR
jgi:chromosome segregation ATPase